MSDDLTLKSTLRDLPRVGAGPEFTARVMAQLQQRQLAPASPSLWRPLLAAAAVVTVVVLVASWQRPDDRRHERTFALSNIAAEHQRLSQEFDSLRALSQGSRPVLRVDGNDQIDFVVGLDEIAQRPRQRRDGVAMPVSYASGADTY